MTIDGGKAHPIGDIGQRYEVRATGYPRAGATSAIGWTDDRAIAERIAAGIRLAPSCASAEIVDRLVTVEHPCHLGGGEWDHDGKVQDDSFDHEFGTEVVLYRLCQRCGAESEYEPDDGDD